MLIWSTEAVSNDRPDLICFPKLITQPLRNTPESRGDEFRAISAPKLSLPSSKSTDEDIFNFSDASPRFGTIGVRIMTS
jgi:hypothetical protein